MSCFNEWYGTCAIAHSEDFEIFYAKIVKRISSLSFFIYICAPLMRGETKNADN